MGGYTYVNEFEMRRKNLLPYVYLRIICITEKNRLV